MAPIFLTVQRLFPTVLRMSLSASILVLIVWLLRMLLRKAPKWLHCLLWALAAVRLVCPSLPESPVSLMPKARVQEARIQSVLDAGLPTAEFETLQDHAINQARPEDRNVSVGHSATPSEYLPFVWAIGVLLMLLYALISFLRLKRRVAVTVSLGKDIRICDEIDSPFILGVIRPCIYLPSRLGELQRSLVLAHECAHLWRRDHWWKPLGFLLLSVYWFNPLLWLAYVLLCRDIELACDERAVREMSAQARLDYSQALLDCSRPRRQVAACPLAFGEVSVRQRVRSVLNYRKPAFLVVAAAVLICAIAALCFLTNPVGFELNGVEEVTVEGIRVSDEGASELIALLSSHRRTRFTVGLDDPNSLSRSVEIRCANGDSFLLHYQNYSGYSFDPRHPGEDDYRSILTYFKAGEGAKKAWKMDYDFDEAFRSWYTEYVRAQLSGTAQDAPGSTEEISTADPDALSETLFGNDVGDGFETLSPPISEPGALFDAIMLSPAYSSNPGDYLNAHPDEHQQLLSDKSGTLRYIFSEFLCGSQTGLKGQLMRMILDELAPEAQLSIQVRTCQEYFDEWAAAAKRLWEQQDEEWIRMNQPAIWLLQQMVE